MKDEFKIYKFCRFCYSKSIHQVLSLGNMPLAGGFLKTEKEFKNEKLFPLKLYFCSDCYLVQTDLVINKKILFQNYYYSSSAIRTLNDHFKAFAKTIKTKFPKKKFIVEIGSNDGVFLNILKKSGFKVLGVDPAENFVKLLLKKGLNSINDYFSEKVAKKIVEKYKHADIIVSSNTLAHIEDMHDVVKGIRLLLKDDGILIFENHYLGNLLKENQYDMVYHEHQYYHSLLVLDNFFKSHQMEIFNVEKNPIHSGSIRVYVQKDKYGHNKISRNVKKLLAEEKKMKLNSLTTYKRFEDNIQKNKDNLLKLLIKLKKANKKIIGYGASGRGTILSNYCGLDNKILDYVIDDSKLKQELFTPGNHLKIKSSKILFGKNKPDYVILFAWSFFKEIIYKNKEYIKSGGKFILPLPKIKIISKYE